MTVFSTDEEKLKTLSELRSMCEATIFNKGFEEAPVSANLFEEMCQLYGVIREAKARSEDICVDYANAHLKEDGSYGFVNLVQLRDNVVAAARVAIVAAHHAARGKETDVA